MNAPHMILQMYISVSCKSIKVWNVTVTSDSSLMPLPIKPNPNPEGNHNFENFCHRKYSCGIGICGWSGNPSGNHGGQSYE